MSSRVKANHRAVKRDHADSYLLISLVAFGVTVVAVRLFLELTGFPQLGNSVLHIAHALWGALLLFIAVLLPLLFANRWAVQASALLSGIGIGLFIDENSAENGLGQAAPEIASLIGLIEIGQ